MDVDSENDQASNEAMDEVELASALATARDVGVQAHLLVANPKEETDRVRLGAERKDPDHLGDSDCARASWRTVVSALLRRYRGTTHRDR